MKNNIPNSFPCAICKKVYTEESGAEHGFICDDCKQDDYELVLASDTFDDDNGELEYGINWLDEDKNIVDCQWFKTEDERLKAIEKYNLTEKIK